MKGRTIISFDVNTDIWPVINQWANENGYKKKEESGSPVLFQKGVGFLVAPMMFQVHIENQRVHIETWVRANLLVRLFALFLIPAEMAIESGGVKMLVPRKIARHAVNKLMERLGQPLIN